MAVSNELAPNTRVVIDVAKAIAIVGALVWGGWSVSQQVGSLRNESIAGVAGVREELQPIKMDVALMRQSIDDLGVDIGDLKSNRDGNGFVRRDELNARLAPLEVRVATIEAVKKPAN
jgi:hypothetical protein